MILDKQFLWHCSHWKLKPCANISYNLKRLIILSFPSENTNLEINTLKDKIRGQVKL